MGLGLFVLLVGFIFMAGFVLWVWSLVDAIQRPDAEWEEAGQTKLVWTLVLIFTGAIGSVIYLLVARPSLEEVKRGL